MSITLALFSFLSILVAGFFAGLLGSLTGLGGGSVLVPLLTIFYGVPIIFATGASLISTIATSAGSASAYVKEKISNIKIGVGLEVATTSGAIVGSILAVYVYSHNLSWMIYIVFGVVLLFSLVPTIQKGKYEIPLHIPPDKSTKFFQLSGSYHDKKLKKTVTYHGIRWWYGELVMFFAGLISGLLGIGSGALKVLGMDWAMNLPMKVTTTTSNFMIGITAATGSSIYWSEGYIQPFLAAATAMGVVIGSFVGTKVLVRITSQNIRWIFFGVLSFLGVEMVLRGLKNDNLIHVSAETTLILSLIFSVLLIAGLYFKMKGSVTDVK